MTVLRPDAILNKLPAWVGATRSSQAIQFAVVASLIAILPMNGAQGAARRSGSPQVKTSDPGERTASEGPNPIFASTHLLPSPFTLRAGTLVYGTELAFGITDFLQVETSLIRDIYKIYNAGAKLSVIQTSDFAAALTVGYENYNLKDVNSLNPDFRLTSWQPGLVTAFTLLPRVALFWGANLNETNVDIRADAAASSGYQRGARTEFDLTWAYNPSTSARAVSNALSTGVSYDFTYHLVGYGVSHHWPGFHFGIHYYPNAGSSRIQPILAGGGSVSF
ncbi:MAG: hypothetical protein H7222_06755 [Methylotenera sp.]|nr:hypothetical protein [Oligoflexia bacterium]